MSNWKILGDFCVQYLQIINLIWFFIFLFIYILVILSNSVAVEPIFLPANVPTAFGVPCGLLTTSYKVSMQNYHNLDPLVLFSQ